MSLQKKQYSSRQTATFVRNALNIFQKTYSGIQFSVREGSESLIVTYMDGPTRREVEEVVRPFAGISSLDGEKVLFLNEYIFVERVYSHKMYSFAVGKTCKAYKLPLSEVRSDAPYFSLYPDPYIPSRSSLSKEVYRLLLE